MADRTANSHEGYHTDNGTAVEVFWTNVGDWEYEGGKPCEPGWYWHACLPGCLPDSDSFGPFDTSEAAYHDALDY